MILEYLPLSTPMRSWHTEQQNDAFVTVVNVLCHCNNMGATMWGQDRGLESRVTVPVVLETYREKELVKRYES